MIEVAERDHSNGHRYVSPVMHCDVCGEPITDTQMAAVPFNMGTGEFNHVHKRQCHDTAERQLGDHTWKEMHDFMDMLVESMAPGAKIKWPWRED